MANILPALKKLPRPAWWAAGVLLCYALLGFFLVPWIAERQFRAVLDQRLALTAEIEKLYFNPFSMNLEIAGIRVTDSGEPLLGLQRLHVNFQPTRLALLRLHFFELAVEQLDVYIERDSETENTFSTLTRRWAASAEPGEPEPVVEGNEEPALVPFVLEHAAFSDLHIHVRDAVPSTPFETTLTLTSAQIDNVSSLEFQPGNNAMVLQFEGDARLRWTGSLQLNPPIFDGELALENLGLAIVSRYLQESIPVTIDAGVLDLSLAYHVDLSGESLAMALDNIDIAISDLAGAQTGEAAPFLTAGRLALDNGSLLYPDNRLAAETLSLEQVALAVDRDSRGSINLQEMMAVLQENGSTGTSESTAADEPANPLALRVERLQLVGSRITVADAVPAAPAAIGLTVEAELTGLDNQPGSTFPLTAGLSFDSGGELQVEGQIGVLPALDMETSITLDRLDLTVLQPYLNEFASISLHSGYLTLDAELASNPEQPLGYRGDLQLLEVMAADQQQDETLLQLPSMALDAIDLSLASSSLEISEIVFASPFARIVINEDGSTNISRSIKPPAVSDRQDEIDTTATDDGGASEGEFTVTVGRVRVNDGASDFTDLNLPIVFNASIHELNGSAEGFATASSQPMALSLEGNVDEFGLVQFSSRLNPFDITRQSQLELEFRNLELPRITPYAIKFAGRQVDEGYLDVSLVYELEGGELTANNHMVLRDLRLGERVEHPSAMELPLDLATALLKDGNGVIDLEIPVNGDVNDPEFDLGPAIRRAITNVLTGIVAAPFRLLGNLVGGGENGLDSVKFQAGRSDIAPPEQQILQRLHEALLQRPQLVLEIPPVTAESDRQALKISTLNNRIEAQLELIPEDSGSLTERRMMAVETLYTQVGLTPALEEIRRINSQVSSETNPLTGEPLTPPQLDVPAYVEDLRSRLVEAEPISDQDLAALAMARADAVSAYLVSLGRLEASRLQVDAQQTGEVDDDGWLIMTFELTAGTSR